MHITRVFILLLGLMTLGWGLAQQPAYAPTCAQTLGMTPDAFNDTFTQRNQDASEAGQDQAAVYWADCKHKANLAQLRGSPQRTARLMRLRDLENKLFSAETYIAYQQSGGGTIYPHSRARFQPAIEQHIGRVIALTATTAGAATSSAIKSRYQKAVGTVSANIKRLKNPTRRDLDYTLRKDWDASVREYETAWKGILGIANAPDAASLEIVEFVARGLWMNEIVR